ncbi:hypothetical protein [Glycomyces buryatensis]|uniref:Uncharacterized protein n=1 Tax=Glycomyces buryatensis TaxID=2570927 RepID=A0A4S8QIL9_9ACTN|nr:hypothetical protein [Glycomyces buryatensis]THV43601.1 hypothetical protein FAB82_00655 [Glycomyces buryatensis]
MAQQLETASLEAGEPTRPVETAAVPASPASLWTSESKVHYSITHTGEFDPASVIDCDCVIHGESTTTG